MRITIDFEVDSFLGCYPNIYSVVGTDFAESFSMDWIEIRLITVGTWRRDRHSGNYFTLL